MFFIAIFVRRNASYGGSFDGHVLSAPCQNPNNVYSMPEKDGFVLENVFAIFVSSVLMSVAICYSRFYTEKNKAIKVSKLLANCHMNGENYS